MSPNFIDALVTLGQTHYEQIGADGSPDAFATKAAHLYVCQYDIQQKNTCSDSIAFLQSIHALSTLITATSTSAQLADMGVKRDIAAEQYKAILAQSLSQFQSNHSLPTTQTQTGPSHQACLDEPALRALIDKIKQIYLTNQHSAALNPEYGYPHYLHGYAAARTAYRYAIALSAQESHAEARHYTFKTILKQRLETELTPHFINPSFFIQVMCSDYTKKLGLILLITGLIALTLLAATYYNPAIDGALMTLGLGHLFPLKAALTGCISSSLLFGTRFFIHQDQQTRNKQSQEAITRIEQTPMSIATDKGA